MFLRVIRVIRPFRVLLPTHFVTTAAESLNIRTEER
jgi:hypothetical protein